MNRCRKLIRIAYLGRELGVTYHTARKDVEFLLAREILTPLEGSRPRAYVSRAIFTVAYGEEAG